MNAESAKQRPANGHSQISRVVKLVGEKLEEVKIDIKSSNKKSTTELVANIDGGHIKARGDNRSFEAMIVTVYKPDNLKRINKSHDIIGKRLKAVGKTQVHPTPNLPILSS